MLSCKQVTELSSRELEQPLRAGETLRVMTHVMMCAGCRNFRRQLVTLRQAARDYAEGRAASTQTGGGGGVE